LDDGHNLLYTNNDNAGNVKNMNNSVDNVNTVNTDDGDEKSSSNEDDSDETDASGTASSRGSTTSASRSDIDAEHVERDNRGHHDSDFDKEISDPAGVTVLTKEDLQSAQQDKLDVDSSSKQDAATDETVTSSKSLHPSGDANNSESNDTGKDKSNMYYSDSSVLEAFTDAKAREPETAYPAFFFFFVAIVILDYS
jgi:hypothetical protein